MSPVVTVAARQTRRAMIIAPPRAVSDISAGAAVQYVSQIDPGDDRAAHEVAEARMPRADKAPHHPLHDKGADIPAPHMQGIRAQPTPSYSPMPIPKLTQHRSVSSRPSGEKRRTP